MMLWRSFCAACLILLSVAGARADGHTHLSCVADHALKTTFDDGHVHNARAAAPASRFAIDIDFEHKTINGTYDAPSGQQFENASVTIGGYASKPASEHEAGYQDTISIDRISGTVVVTHRVEPPDDCAEHVASCRMSETTVIYRCTPGVSGFPTPIPRMIRWWERLRHSAVLARMRHVWRRLTTSVERHLAPIVVEPIAVDK